MSLVMYQVERRPVSSGGKIYRGTGRGDFICVLSHPSNFKNTDFNNPLGASFGGSGEKLVGAGFNVPLNSSSGAKSNIEEISGEPWLVHSTHFSVESAVSSAAPLASSIGAENVRIVKVITGSFEFKLK